MPVLLKFQMDYADEFDVYGFEVVTEELWEKYKQMFKCVSYPNEYYFGTNEMVTFEDEAEVLRAITVTELSIMQADALKALFESSYGDAMAEFGWTPFGAMQEDIPEEDYDKIFG